MLLKENFSENSNIEYKLESSKEDNSIYSYREIFGDFMKSEASLDKSEITELINMMFRFQTRTGCSFKIEEYIGSVFILTDPNKLCSSDVESFFSRNQDISGKIWLTPIPKNKKILNVYEDCFKSRRVPNPPYISNCCLIDIVKRPKSVSFILDS